MSPEGQLRETIHRTGDLPGGSPRTRLAYALLPVIVGGLFTVLHLPHLVADIEAGVGLPAFVSGALFPVLLSLALVGGGGWLWWCDLPAASLRRVNFWFGIGIAASTSVGGMVLLYESLEGAVLTHLGFVMLNFATAGGIGGLTVGWYDARSRRQQEQLRVYQKAVEYAGHSIYLTTPDGTIVYVNPAFETQTGYGRTEAIGRTPEILQSGEHDEAFYAEMWETILSGEVWRDEIVNARQDGTRYHVDQTIAPIKDDRGNLRYFVAINTEITEIKEYEAELERQNERLAEFASVLSHDLRNPLNLATGHLQLARERFDDDEDLETIGSALERMEALIEDILTLARQGESIGEREVVTLAATCRTVWEQVDSAEATLRVETDARLHADESRLQQLFENLFRNAVEHGGRGVTLTVGEHPDGFYVADDGAGLPDDERDSLFESGVTTTAQGTGFGLAIVDRIASAHGWTVSATESRDGGARFEVGDVGGDLQLPQPQEAG